MTTYLRLLSGLVAVILGTASSNWSEMPGQPWYGVLLGLIGIYWTFSALARLR